MPCYVLLSSSNWPLLMIRACTISLKGSTLGGPYWRVRKSATGIYHGRFIEFLEEINKLSCWRRILGKTEPDSRQRDIELLVRFFAMRDRSAYKKPMKDFLSKYTQKEQECL